MKRVIFVGLLVGLLFPSAGTAQQRPQCLNPPPIFNPLHPGACFIDTPFGAFFFLSDGSDFLFVETFGGSDDNVKLMPNGRISSHQTDRNARFIFCPAGVTGPDCISSILRPGPKALSGRGMIHVNTEMDPFLNFTCPSTVTARALVAPRGTHERSRLVVELHRVRNPDGSCRNGRYDIRLLP